MQSGEKLLIFGLSVAIFMYNMHAKLTGTYHCAETGVLVVEYNNLN